MPTLRNHKHCQVARKERHTNQNVTKSRNALVRGLTAENKALKHNTLYISLAVFWNANFCISIFLILNLDKFEL